MIHASGDLDWPTSSTSVRGAADAGVQGFREGVPIVTDVRMVARGIQAPLREPLVVGLHCFLEAAWGVWGGRGPRADARACAMEHAVATLPRRSTRSQRPDGAEHLCAAVRRGAARHAWLSPMPVGFVGVIESKEEALLWRCRPWSCAGGGAERGSGGRGECPAAARQGRRIGWRATWQIVCASVETLRY